MAGEVCEKCGRPIGRFYTRWSEDNVVTYTCVRCVAVVPLFMAGALLIAVILALVFGR